jgi:hypothetical protein
VIEGGYIILAKIIWNVISQSKFFDFRSVACAQKEKKAQHIQLNTKWKMSEAGVLNIKIRGSA